MIMMTHMHMSDLDCIYGGIVLDNECASCCHASPQVCPPETAVGNPTRCTREGEEAEGGGGQRMEGGEGIQATRAKAADAT